MSDDHTKAESVPTQTTEFPTKFPEPSIPEEPPQEEQVTTDAESQSENGLTAKREKTAEIRQMKRSGDAKPEDVSWGDWFLPVDELSPHHEALCYMLAVGMRPKSIVQELEIHNSRISVLKSNDLIKSRVKEIQKEIFGENYKARLQNLLPQAIERLADTIVDEGEKTSNRNQAAMYLIDQAIGKATQKVEHHGDQLPQLLQLIHGLKQSGQVIDITNQKDPSLPASHTDANGNIQEGEPGSQATEKQLSDEESEDPIDSWVKSNIPAQVVSTKDPAK
jgi:hypothetical protein